jgi:hypothetical protein
MMIFRYHDSVYALVCDSCGDEADETFDSFMEAVEFKKDRDNNWRSVKDKNGDWQDVCPSCNCPEVLRKLMGVEDD